jgi:hypothetical protein
MGATEASRRKAWRLYLLVSDAQTSSQATTPTARQPQRRRRPTRRRRRSRRDARNLQEKQDGFFRALRFGRRKTRPRQRELGAEPEPALPTRPPTTVLWSRSQGRMEEGGELGLGLGFVWEGECVWVSERGAPGA